MDEFEAVADLLEGFAEAFFERALEFFVHGGTHLFELLGVVFADGRELLSHRFAEQIRLFAAGVDGGIDLLGKVFELCFFRIAKLGLTLRHGVADVFELCLDFLAGRLGGGGVFEATFVRRLLMLLRQLGELRGACCR